MIPLDKLVPVFDLVMAHPVATSIPTPSSVRRINSELGVHLPDSLVAFARESKKFGSWFLSLGEDYSNPFHILAMNAALHSPVREGVDTWRPMPRNLIMFNHGYDEDYDCIDISSPSLVPGEYKVRYWCPLSEDGMVFDTFPLYMQHHISDWVEHAKKATQALVRRELQT
ncbi:MAG: SMI1/KNR4 family protein [Pseudomonadota bacterium]